MIVRSCFVSANCRKDSISCFSRLQDQIESHWLDFLHGIRAEIFWAESLHRIFEYFGVKFSKTNRIFGFLAKIYPNGKKNEKFRAVMREVSSIKTNSFLENFVMAGKLQCA